MGDRVRVRVRLYGVLRDRGPGHDETTERDYPAGTTVGEALPPLGIARDAEASVLVDGRVVGWDYVLREGDRLLVVPPLAGGAWPRARRSASGPDPSTPHRRTL